jgi:hypothetical protein
MPPESESVNPVRVMTVVFRRLGHIRSDDVSAAAADAPI